MDENDGVRTRLTHSHEVANLAKSLGARIHAEAPTIFGGIDLHTKVLPLLGAIGLAHDIGNPPFGHRGEAAMARWFDKRKKWIFTHKNEQDGQNEPNSPNIDVVPAEYQAEFTKFDGNPHGIRLIARLQTSVAFAGLDLTATTLAACLKYSVSSAYPGPAGPARKKIGYFESERSIIEWIRQETGIAEGQRHPLTWIMEACDDIAYSVLDVDDAMTKCAISPDDTLSILKSSDVKDLPAIKWAAGQFDKVASSGRHSQAARDIKVDYLRAALITNLLQEASAEFVKSAGPIFDLTHNTALMDNSKLANCLKDIAHSHAFTHKSVLKTEALGAAAIDGLMTVLWDAIAERKEPNKFRSRRSSARLQYAFSHISPNYVDEAERASQDTGVAQNLRYRELRLLTDMIAGMTDTFAIKLWENLRTIPNVDGT